MSKASNNTVVKKKTKKKTKTNKNIKWRSFEEKKQVCHMISFYKKRFLLLYKDSCDEFKIIRKEDASKYYQGKTKHTNLKKSQQNTQ